MVWKEFQYFIYFFSKKVVCNYTNVSNKHVLANYKYTLSYSTLFANVCICYLRYEFFNDLYHRFLLTNKINMKCMCLHALAIVYSKCYEDIGAFNDTRYIVQMLDRVCVMFCVFVYTTGTYD